jgi:hypothetical protein
MSAELVAEVGHVAVKRLRRIRTANPVMVDDSINPSIDLRHPTVNPVEKAMIDSHVRNRRSRASASQVDCSDIVKCHPAPERESKTSDPAALRWSDGYQNQGGLVCVVRGIIVNYRLPTGGVNTRRRSACARNDSCALKRNPLGQNENCGPIGGPRRNDNRIAVTRAVYGGNNG